MQKMAFKVAEISVRTWSGSGEMTRMGGKRSRKREREKRGSKLSASAALRSLRMRKGGEAYTKKSWRSTSLSWKLWGR